MFIAWALFGSLIGIAAAQRRGFSTVAGFIDGFLLGPFAILMFLISGVTRHSTPLDDGIPAPIFWSFVVLLVVLIIAAGLP